ncbi:MAG: NHL repeat-containing protein, partial [Solirubrobacteraceae bacterium]
ATRLWPRRSVARSAPRLAPGAPRSAPRARRFAPRARRFAPRVPRSALLLPLAAAATLAVPAGASADNVYWSATSGSTLLAGNAGGGPVSTLFSGQEEPAQIALDPVAGLVYWADTKAGTIDVGSLAGGPARTLYTEPAGSKPVGIAINANTKQLYWTDEGSGQLNVNGSVREGSTAGGGTPKTLFAEPARARPTGLAVNSGASGALYWTDSGTGEIRAGALEAGATARTLYATEPGRKPTEPATVEPSGIAIDAAAGTLLWTEALTGNIDSAPLGGGGTFSTLYTEPAGSKPRGLAVNTRTSALYWTNSGSGEVRVSSLAAGGVQSTLFGAQAQPSFPAVLGTPVGIGVPKIFSPQKVPNAYRVGNTLECGTGRWAGNAPGANYYASPRTYSYQWSHEGTPIPGANAATYAPPSEGAYTCTDTAGNAAGATPQTSVTIKVLAPPPAASIASPLNGAVYEQYAVVPTSFACTEGAGGPGLASCRDGNGANAPSGKLTTSYLGARTYSVVAISKNGKRAKASVTYTIVPRKPVLPPPKAKPKPSKIAIMLDKTRVKGRHALILLACRGGTPCRGVLSIVARVRVRRGGHVRRTTVLLEKKSYFVHPAESRDVPVLLSPHGHYLLTRSRHHKLWVRVRVTLDGGASKHRGVMLILGG